MTLQELLDEINQPVTSVAGVNPEGDSSGITMSYDASSDRIFIDSGEKLPGTHSTLPVLGSSTDTSNFLQSMRLLSRTTEWMDADIEAGAVISTFTAGDESKSWVIEPVTLVRPFIRATPGVIPSTMEKYMKE